MTKKKAATKTAEDKTAEEKTAPPADEKLEAPKEKRRIRTAHRPDGLRVDGKQVRPEPPKAPSTIYPDPEE